MSKPPFDVRALRFLLADWFRHLSVQAGFSFEQHGTGATGLTIGDPSAFHVNADFIDAPPFLRFVGSDATKQGAVDAIARAAAAKVHARDFGSTAWHSVTCATSPPDLSSMLPGMGSFMELLGSQSRFVGWAKLGRFVFVEFEEAPLGGEWNPDQTLFAPKALCHIHVAVPAPCPGFFSSYAAPSFVEVAVAICTFALGRAVTLPPAVFATPPDKVAKLDAKRADIRIGTLARKGVPLDVLGFLDHPGGQEIFDRVRSALLTFDAAKQTKHDSVACVLFVVTAECLTSVHTPWQTEKITRRFWEFFEQLTPADLDAIVNHQNFLEVFDIKRGGRTDKQMRKKVLEKIYSFRSGNVHSGLKPIYRGFASGVDGGSIVRRSFFADFAEAAILRFIESPRSSVVGHPNILLEAEGGITVSGINGAITAGDVTTVTLGIDGGKPVALELGPLVLAQLAELLLAHKGHADSA